MENSTAILVFFKKKREPLFGEKNFFTTRGQMGKQTQSCHIYYSQIEIRQRTAGSINLGHSSDERHFCLRSKMIKKNILLFSADPRKKINE